MSPLFSQNDHLPHLMSGCTLLPNVYMNPSWERWMAPTTTISRVSPRSENNKIQPGDRPVHEWYRFVLSFPPHLVRTYLERFNVGNDQLVLDPFCGTGTTLVECKKRG